MPTEAPYILVSRLGEGGMAEVYKAIKTGPEGWKKPVALKRILPQYADHPDFLRLLKEEARLHARLDHPNIVAILDFFRHDRSFLIALEYVHGKNLKAVIADAGKKPHPLPWQAAVFIIGEILKALDYAHKSQGDSGPLKLVHRDVSPQNILISYSGLVKLSDFGIAHAEVAGKEAGSGVLRGKHRYLAPEQLKKAPVDFRADLFATGVVLYELLTGRHPFDAESELELLKKIERAEFPPSEPLAPEVPAPIHEAITRALALDPSARHADAAAFRRLLLERLDTPWLSAGSDLLEAWLTELYPDPAEREEPPLEHTPILSDHGTSIPVALIPTESLMVGTPSIQPSDPGPDRPLIRARFLWAAAGAALVSGGAGLTLLKDAARPNPPAVQTSAAPAGSPETAAPVSTGRLHITGPKGGRVFLNGIFVGRLPLTEEQERVSTGGHLVSVRSKKGRTTHIRVRIEFGKTLSLKAPFKAKK